MNEIAAGIFSIASRQSLPQVIVSKLVDVYGYNISSALKEKVSTWLAEITNMKPSDFFVKKTHTGFLNKDLHNRWHKLPASEKRWVWSKKARPALSDGGTPCLSQPSQEITDPSNVEQHLMELEGCPRFIMDCDICGGRYSHIACEIFILHYFASLVRGQEHIFMSLEFTVVNSKEVPKNLKKMMC
jgi:hypothetical protein